MKTPSEVHTEPEFQESTEPRRPWWKRRVVWISGLVLLLIVAPLTYYLFFSPKSQSSASSGSVAPVDYVQSIVFSPDGHVLVAAVNHFDDGGSFTDSSIIEWDSASGKKLHALSGQRYINSAAFSPDGQDVAIGSEDEDILFWNAESGQVVPTHFADSSAVYSLAFSPNGQLLATGDDDGTVKLWNAASGKLLKTFPSPTTVGGATTVAFSPDGRLLAAGSTTLRLWNVATGKTVALFPQASKIVGITSLAFSPDGRLLALGSETMASGDTESITLWNLSGEAKTSTLTTQGTLVYSLCFSPDGRTLAAASEPGVIERWDVATGKKYPDIQGANEQVIAFSPDGHTLASTGADFSSNPNQDTSPAQSTYIELRDATSGKQLRILT